MATMPQAGTELLGQRILIREILAEHHRLLFRPVVAYSQKYMSEHCYLSQLSMA
jgi:hypothetical protein